ncbi:hypothetical protein [Sphingomonas sp.]|uniref:hypothetical protein n=1 Tax=Sphingomonas sp. TaxID=28214 RepID=UPI00333FEB05
MKRIVLAASLILAAPVAAQTGGAPSAPTGQKYQQQSLAILGDPGVAAWQSGVAARAQARVKDEVETLLAEVKPIFERDESQKNAKHS